MYIYLNETLRRSKDIQRKAERRQRVADFLKGVLVTIALCAAFYLALAIPSYIHSRDCDVCDWFWCNHYTGKGMI